MDFEGKDELTDRIRRLAGEREKLLAFRELALTLARKYDPGLSAGLEAAAADADAPKDAGRPARLAAPAGAERTTRLPRERARAVTQPGTVR